MAKRIKTKSAKAKGSKLQKWICEKLSKIINIPWGYEDDKLIQSRPANQKGTDVILRGRARELIPFSFEAKNQEKWSIPSYIKQAKSNMYPETDWIVVCKKNRVNPIVVMDAEVFFKLLKRIKELEKEK